MSSPSAMRVAEAIADSEGRTESSKQAASNYNGREAPLAQFGTDSIDSRFYELREKEYGDNDDSVDDGDIGDDERDARSLDEDDEEGGEDRYPNNDNLKASQFPASSVSNDATETPLNEDGNVDDLEDDGEEDDDEVDEEEIGSEGTSQRLVETDDATEDLMDDREELMDMPQAGREVSTAGHSDSPDRGGAAVYASSVTAHTPATKGAAARYRGAAATGAVGSNPFEASESLSSSSTFEEEDEGQDAYESGEQRRMDGVEDFEDGDEDEYGDYDDDDDEDEEDDEYASTADDETLEGDLSDGQHARVLPSAPFNAPGVATSPHSLAALQAAVHGGDSDLVSQTVHLPLSVMTPIRPPLGVKNDTKAAMPDLHSYSATPHSAPLASYAGLHSLNYHQNYQAAENHVKLISSSLPTLHHQGITFDHQSHEPRRGFPAFPLPQTQPQAAENDAIKIGNQYRDSDPHLVGLTADFGQRVPFSGMNSGNISAAIAAIKSTVLSSNYTQQGTTEMRQDATSLSQYQQYQQQDTSLHQQHNSQLSQQQQQQQQQQQNLLLQQRLQHQQQQQHCGTVAAEISPNLATNTQPHLSTQPPRIPPSNVHFISQPPMNSSLPFSAAPGINRRTSVAKTSNTFLTSNVSAIQSASTTSTAPSPTTNTTVYIRSAPRQQPSTTMTSNSPYIGSSSLRASPGGVPFSQHQIQSLEMSAPVSTPSKTAVQIAPTPPAFAVSSRSREAAPSVHGTLNSASPTVPCASSMTAAAVTSTPTTAANGHVRSMSPSSVISNSQSNANLGKTELSSHSWIPAVAQSHLLASRSAGIFRPSESFRKSSTLPALSSMDPSSYSPQSRGPYALTSRAPALGANVASRGAPGRSPSRTGTPVGSSKDNAAFYGTPRPLTMARAPDLPIVYENTKAKKQRRRHHKSKTTDPTVIPHTDRPSRRHIKEEPGPLTKIGLQAEKLLDTFVRHFDGFACAQVDPHPPRRSNSRIFAQYTPTHFASPASSAVRGFGARGYESPKVDQASNKRGLGYEDHSPSRLLSTPPKLVPPVVLARSQSVAHYGESNKEWLAGQFPRAVPSQSFRQDLSRHHSRHPLEYHRPGVGKGAATMSKERVSEHGRFQGGFADYTQHSLQQRQQRSNGGMSHRSQTPSQARASSIAYGGLPRRHQSGWAESGEKSGIVEAARSLWAKATRQAFGCATTDGMTVR